MKSAIKKILATVDQLQKSENFRDALRLVDESLIEWKDHPRLLMLRGMLIQLVDEDAEHSLKDAKLSFIGAIESDPDAIEPLLELGHFQNAVEDNSRAALESYRAASELAEQAIIQALLGELEVMKELNQEEEIERCRKTIAMLQLAMPNIQQYIPAEVREELNHFLAHPESLSS